MTSSFGLGLLLLDVGWDRLDLSEVPGKAVLSLGVKETSFFAGHVVDPLLVTPQTTLSVLLDTYLSPFGSQIIPTKCVSNSANFIRDTRGCGVAHLLPKFVVCEEFQQMGRNGLPVARGDKESVNLVLDLEGNASGIGNDNWAACVESLRYLHLETLAGRELKYDMRVGEQGVDQLIVGVQTHDAHILDQVRIVALKLAHALIVDQTSIRVVNGTIAAHHQLGDIGNAGLVALATELSIRVDDSGDTLRGIETSDLDDVLASGPIELSPERANVSDVHLIMGMYVDTHMRCEWQATL